MAATMAPVSSNRHILRVMAARITAVCHSSGSVQAAGPVAPITRRVFLEPAGGVLDAALERFVGAEQHADAAR